MTTTRLPRACERMNAQLAAELRKQWPPAHRTPPASTAPKHEPQSLGFRQTGDVIDFPMTDADQQIGAGASRL